MKFFLVLLGMTLIFALSRDLGEVPLKFTKDISAIFLLLSKLIFRFFLKLGLILFNGL
jgi:hypothetical protein